MSHVKVVTAEVRLSYCNVFEPKAISGSEPKYSVSVLIPKSDTATIETIEKAIAEVVETEKASKFGGKTKALKLPLRDGDKESDDEAYEGHMFFSAVSKTRPFLYDENRQAIIDPRALYSGCYARVSVNFYAFNVENKKGVAAGLNAIMKTRDGEALGGTYTEAAALEDFEEGDLL